MLKLKKDIKSSSEVNKGTLGMRKHDALTAYLMLAPGFILITIFVIVPFFYSIAVSFTDWSFYGTSKFVGFKNYRVILTNKLFRTSLTVAIKYVLIIVPTLFIVSFLFSHVLKGMKGKAASFAKTSVYIPTVISGILAAAIFTFIYDYQGGILNSILANFGIPKQAFLKKPLISSIALSIPIVWLGFGYNTLVMLAGLLDIPQVYYEAADVEGANAFEKLIYITIPSMKNIFILITITLVTGALTEFNVPYMMTGGGPTNSNLTPIVYIFNNFKSNPTMGPTVAASLLMVIVLSLISGLIFTIIKSEKSMDA
ncbi:sugar ABC transporter permease [Clostridium swellfunianum]|uniref:carbohydrate ABC transporter permease n=1 Tax=Clostridium swellfunianum TaxID=1367462 RepID=UPI00202F21E8|nr:sugar ABC transporter permease [Clostridium swellfunianum]